MHEHNEPVQQQAQLVTGMIAYVTTTLLLPLLSWIYSIIVTTTGWEQTTFRDHANSDHRNSNTTRESTERFDYILKDLQYMKCISWSISTSLRLLKDTPCQDERLLRLLRTEWMNHIEQSNQELTFLISTMERYILTH
ncbi:hypothetical protein C9374_013571 [Naegleria lovaniensis]|uniref:Uncharacterized protein n=1 Tax=Naegleria lovaniensis TaxID=51637 RepID=A0AA88H0U1_NAELO|nr:uncharacterized protein C9374_013571 [Naegleria lovaniensis]KAG2392086.1 hypothetical protein C9374_013571 [Naegleria lovaniensis]